MPSKHHHTTRWWRAAWWACAATWGLSAWAYPGAGQWTYKVSGQTRGIPYTAQANLEWQPQGHRYTARMEIKAFLVGARRQVSEGTLAGHELQPQLFTDQRKHTKRVVLDTAQRVVRFEETGQQAPLPAGTQDRLSLFFHLGHKLGSVGGHGVGQRWAVPVVGATDIETWTFVVQHGDAPGQWRLSRLPRHGGDQTLDIWYGKEPAGVPLRIRLTAPDGDQADQVLVAP
jgi:hypothetical protein